MVKKTFHLKCRNCGNIFTAHASNTMYCPDCYVSRECSNPGCKNVIEGIFIGDTGSHYCSRKCRYAGITARKTAPGVCFKCGQWSEVRNSVGQCPECTSKEKLGSTMKDRVYMNLCKKCGKPFEAKTANTKFCKDCYIVVKCQNCGKEMLKPPVDEPSRFCSLQCANIYGAKERSKPGNCVQCGQWSERRDASGRCSHCVGLQVADSWRVMNDEQIASRTAGLIHQGITMEHCENCDGDTYHNGKRCLICNPVINMGFKGTQTKYCKRCNRETYHVGFRCLVCNPLPHGKIVYMRHCNLCGLETPHKINLDDNLRCQVCDGEKIWCEHCQQWETTKYNSQSRHWLYYKSITAEWMEENPKTVRTLHETISGLNDLESMECTSGIYMWKIGNIPWYIGQSTDILSRTYDHMMNLVLFPEYWGNPFENNLLIEIVILEKANKSQLNALELHWIEEMQPVSQRCDGTDRIIPLHERKIVDFGVDIQVLQEAIQ